MITLLIEKITDRLLVAPLIDILWYCNDPAPVTETIDHKWYFELYESLLKLCTNCTISFSCQVKIHLLCKTVKFLANQPHRLTFAQSCCENMTNFIDIFSKTDRFRINLVSSSLNLKMIYAISVWTSLYFLVLSLSLPLKWIRVVGIKIVMALSVDLRLLESLAEWLRCSASITVHKKGAHTPTPTHTNTVTHTLSLRSVYL